MVDHLLVERILNDINSFVAELHGVEDVDYEEFQKNTQLRRFIERTLHIAIEATIDIGQHIIADQGYREPESYKDTFTVLNENSIITDELLAKLHMMAAFRNLLVHYYEKIDDTIVFSILKKNLNDFIEFSSQIIDYLKSESNNG
jgi:uncharacterized protein YutE (UPF0331/DUF86 family)